MRAYRTRGRIRAVTWHTDDLRRAAETFSELPEADGAEEVQRELGDRVTNWAREHPEALLYVARLNADQDPAALAIFDGFVAIARGQWQRLAEAGLLREDLDLDWAALQSIIVILGSAIFEGAIGRHLEWALARAGSARSLEPGELGAVQAGPVPPRF